jgi:predicted DNA-binding protein with PD1-like motif
MVAKKLVDGYLVRFDKNELLVSSLSDFCSQKKIKAGWINGLGAALWADLAFYHLQQKSYEYERIDESLEVTNLTGNISEVNGQVFVHIHATVSDMNYHAYAGHLKELEVSATCEVKITVFDKSLSRVHNDAIGLKVLDL